MSILDSHRDAALTNGLFAEVFYYFIDSQFSGVFDHSWTSSNADAGHADQKQRRPRIMVGEVPERLSVDDEIVRAATGERFHVLSIEKDPGNISSVWLY